MYRNGWLRAHLGSVGVLGVFLLVTALTSLYSYLLFHTTAELFSIIIAVTIFIIAWNSREYLDNYYLLFLGIAYLFIAGIDLVHTLSYSGMNIFTGYGANLSTQLWIAGRSLEAATLIAAPLMIRRRLDARLLVAGYAGIFALLMGSIFWWGIFPDCYIEGAELTPFKIYAEYVISGALVLSILLLWQRRESFDRDILKLVILSIIATIGSELAFTFYVSVYGFSNLVGHLLKIISFALIYFALVESGIRRPYDLIFRNLKQSEEKFRGLFTHMNEGFALHRMVYDDEGQVRDYLFDEVNLRFGEILAMPPAEIPGRTGTEVFSTDEPPYLEEFGRVAASGEAEQFETFFEPVQKHFLFSLFSPGKGECANVFTDISRRKQKEAALNLAMKKIQVLTQITRHDILNSVMAADGYLDLIPDASPEEVQEYLESIRRMIARIQRQIEFTREYQQIGENPPVWQDPTKIIAACIADEERCADIRVDIDLPPVEILADPMFPRVFANIIQNALIHGEGISRLSFTAREEEGGPLVIACEDDGAGIPDEKKESIFRSGYGRNHGFGLYLVSEILDLTGISIAECGTPGEGARFEIRVPADRWRQAGGG